MMQLIATNPQELEKARDGIVKMLMDKLVDCNAQIAMLEENIEVATRSKWRTSALKSARNREIKLRTYYEKARSIVESGYHIIPHLPTTAFAIRTKAKNPRRMQDNRGWDDKMQKSQSLAQGEGEYVSPLPLIQSDSWTEKTDDGKAITKSTYWAEEWDVPGFPVTAVRPEVMDATSSAFAQKVFDEIGIAPSSGCGDPMIIGTIYGPNNKRLEFLIAWFLDESHL